MNANLFQHISDAIADTGKVAIETPGGARVTYEDLIHTTGRIANALQGLGVRPGDRLSAGFTGIGEVSCRIAAMSG